MGQTPAPDHELEALYAEIRRLDERVQSLREEFAAKLGAIEGRSESEARRLDTRIDALQRELDLAIELRERIAALEGRVLS